MNKKEKIAIAEKVLTEAFRGYEPDFDIPASFTESVMAEIDTEFNNNKEIQILFKISWIAAGLSAAMLVISTFFVFYHNSNDDLIGSELQSYFQQESYDSILTDIAK